LKKNLIDKVNQQKNNVLEPSFPALETNVMEDSSKLKMCCFYNDNYRRYYSFETKLQNKVRESGVETFPHHVLEQSSTNDNEILRVKNIFKIDTPFR
jgi:hypothetical protein